MRSGLQVNPRSISICGDWVKLGETSLKTFISQYVLVFGIVSFAVAQIIYIVSFGFEQRQVSKISIQALPHNLCGIRRFLSQAISTEGKSEAFSTTKHCPSSRGP